MAMKKTREIKACAALAATIVLASPASAQNEAESFSGSFAVPIFNSIDANGVDLITGTWRVRTPTISTAANDPRQPKYERGLEWTGQAWTHIGHPKLWRDGSKHIVMHDGRSYEFNGRGSGWSERHPKVGATLDCAFELPSEAINRCEFRAPNGDKVYFIGFYSTLQNYGSDFGFSTMQFGNVGIQQVLISRASAPYSVSQLQNQWLGGTLDVGQQVQGVGAPRFDYQYDDVDYYIWVPRINFAGVTNINSSNIDSRLKITTPNNNDSDDHYLRPRNTTQTVTDDFGTVWSYTFNSDRELTRVQNPGGLAPIDATYGSSNRVVTVVTPAGTTTYSYTRNGDNGTTTATAPNGEVSYVEYNHKYGYVTLHRDPLGRETTYSWNSSTRRLDRITYPEDNYSTFTYDARGNVVSKKDYPKGGGTPLEYQAGGFPPTCTSANWGNCNKPRFVVDPKGNRTDFEYSADDTIPTKIIRPSPTPGAPRPTITNEISGLGLVTKTVTCKTQEVCAEGTSDAIVEETIYRSLQYANWILAGPKHTKGWFAFPVEKIVTADGETRRSCLGYDMRGNLVSTTPPLANITSCPSLPIEEVSSDSNSPEIGPAKTVPTFPGGGN